MQSNSCQNHRRPRFAPHGAPERIRTPNPQIRSLVLYPIELRVHAEGGGLAEPLPPGKRAPDQGAPTSADQAASLSSSRSTASPITCVPTRAQPGAITSGGAQAAGQHAARTPARPAPRPRPGRRNSAAASRSSGSAPAGWRPPCRRCPARCRGSARTAHGAARPRPPRPSVAEGSMPEAAGQHRGEVRQQVAEQVAGDDDVELPRIAHQLHGAVVGVHVRQLDLGEFRGRRSAVTVCRHSSPLSITLAFSTLHTPPLPLARQLEGDARHALDLRRSCRPRC